MNAGLPGGNMHPRWQDLPLFVGSIVGPAVFAAWCIWNQDRVLEPVKDDLAPNGRNGSRVILISAFLASVAEFELCRSRIQPWRFWDSP
jgi:hypothetical protein